MFSGVKNDGDSGDLAEVEWHEIACGDGRTAGVTPTGDLYTLGSGNCDRLGHGNQVDIDKPKLVTCLTGKKLVHVSCGAYHTAVVTSDGDLYTWYVYKVPY